MTRQPIEILVVDSDPSDVRAMRRAFHESKVANHVHVAHDGEEALAYLARKPPFGKAHRPDLILLDLNLPRVDGREVLRSVKANESLRSIPVVVLTGSGTEAEVAEGYALGANCYVRKPVEFRSLVEIVRAIDGFWLSIATARD